jgi:hypothetical protein
LFRWWRSLGITALVTAILLTGGCGLLGGRDDNTGTAPVVAQDEVSPAPVETTEAPEPTTPAPAPTTKKATARPKPSRTSATPTEDPNNFQLPACAHHEGKKVTKAQAKAALTTAAGKIYWPTSAPTLKLSSDLVKSIAWHESGWQSDIVNCDGGRGLMQVMPDTTAQMNQRFGQSYVDTDYKQNAVIGANYLAWLTKYFGDRYFKNKYDLSTKACKTHSSPCLLNMVIAGYNAGAGTVDDAHAAGGDLPSPAYVDSVRSLMTSCYCDRY